MTPGKINSSMLSSEKFFWMTWGKFPAARKYFPPGIAPIPGGKFYFSILEAQISLAQR